MKGAQAPFVLATGYLGLSGLHTAYESPVEPAGVCVTIELSTTHEDLNMNVNPLTDHLYIREVDEGKDDFVDTAWDFISWETDELVAQVSFWAPGGAIHFTQLLNSKGEMEEVLSFDAQLECIRRAHALIPHRMLHPST